MTEKSYKIVGMLAGFGFTALVAGLLVWAHLATPEVPRLPAHGPGRLLVCSTAPDWAWPGSPDFERAVSFWGALGHAWSSIQVGECAAACPFPGEAPAACVQGFTTVDLMSGSRMGVDRVQGVFLANPGGQWAAIEVPGDLEVPLDTPLPSEARALLLAHEMGHAFGFDHVLGAEMFLGVRFAAPQGHVMNPRLVFAGWGGEGL